MTRMTTQPIKSLAEFLAHALELEVESAERYRELADSMEVHNNPDVAELFRKLAGYGDGHAQEVRSAQPACRCRPFRRGTSSGVAPKGRSRPAWRRPTT